MQVAKSLFYFVLAGLCEIGGGYLIWLWLRENRSIWLAVVGVGLLMLYGIIPTLQPANLGGFTQLMVVFLSLFRFYGAGKLIK